jgi:hypothetical protein
VLCILSQTLHDRHHLVQMLQRQRVLALHPQHLAKLVHGACRDFTPLEVLHRRDGVHRRLGVALGASKATKLEPRADLEIRQPIAQRCR